MRADSIIVDGGSVRTAESSADVFARFNNASPTRPFVVGQIGQSLDGRIATVSGESRDISGDAALDHLHRIRAHVDAVVVGAGTIRADDPQLTVRRVFGRNPARVVIDPSARLDAKGKWLAEDGARRILIAGERARADSPAEVVRLNMPGDAIAPAAIVAALFERGLKRILIEGGARTLSLFIEHGALDRLHVLVAPMILGSGRNGFDLRPIQKLENALRPRIQIYALDGGDVLFDCDFSASRCR